MTDKELLQVLIGKVDAQLLKASGKRENVDKKTGMMTNTFQFHLKFNFEFALI